MGGHDDVTVSGDERRGKGGRLRSRLEDWLLQEVFGWSGGG